MQLRQILDLNMYGFDCILNSILHEPILCLAMMSERQERWGLGIITPIG